MVTEIDCHEPIFSTPVVGKDRVYFATLGAQVYAITHEGAIQWQWDFVKEVVGFKGNRWSGQEWAAFCTERLATTLKPGTKPSSSDGRVTWKDHFVCSRDICLIGGSTVVVPAGGRTLFIEDTGANAETACHGRNPRVVRQGIPRDLRAKRGRRGQRLRAVAPARQRGPRGHHAARR